MSALKMKGLSKPTGTAKWGDVEGGVDEGAREVIMRNVRDRFPSGNPDFSTTFNLSNVAMSLKPRGDVSRLVSYAMNIILGLRYIFKPLTLLGSILAV